MRGLSKPWPPQNVSPAGQAARRFVDAEKEYLAALPGAADKTTFARGEFERLEKSELRKVMYREQGSLCAYCERVLVEIYPEPRVDHWRPLSLNHDVALHWKNLYLSCPSPETCDAAKGDRPLNWAADDPDLPWPTDLAYQDIVGFTSRGEMYVRADAVIDDATRRALQLAIDNQQDGDRVRAAILVLNDPALVAARAAAIDSERTRLARDYKNKTAPRSDRVRRAEELLKKHPLPPFVSSRVAWLRRALGKGRR